MSKRRYTYVIRNKIEHHVDSEVANKMWATPVFIVATAAVRPRMHGLSVEMSMTNCKNKNIIKRTLFTHT